MDIVYGWHERCRAVREKDLRLGEKNQFYREAYYEEDLADHGRFIRILI